MKKSAILVAALALPLFLQACQTGPSQRVMTTTAAGAILGAGAGMMAGGDDKRNAAIGAAVGAIAGASVGVYMDKQEEKLRQQTAGTGIEVERQGDQLALTMPSGITFAQSSATIQPAFYTALNNVAATLVEYPSTAVDIRGHASSEGDRGFNQRLSQQRADAVRAYLVNQGVQPVRLTATGMGIDYPVADNSTEAGRVQNRRVEIILTPVSQ
ncbi:MAG: OmpA family protein [Hyphomonas sp.]|jgi:outer membrane protein OmpA-like peptidoglycan-associated protein|nr:OmpA family protein [Hyphomonas sp.]